MSLEKGKLKVVVASENPVKKDDVKVGFSTFFSSIEVEGIQVDSGVPDQPVDDLQTKLGAHNRAANAKLEMPKADFWVGIEGGIEHSEKEISAFAWVVVLSNDKSGEARTTTFVLPPKVSDLIKKGKELGTAIDIVFGQENSKQKRGAVGSLTKNKISRTQLYVQAVQLALVPFINPDLF